MGSIIVAGHSHTRALVGYGDENTPGPHLLPLDGYDNVFGLHSEWPRPDDYWSALIDHAADNAIALLWEGNIHNILYLIEQQPPFDFICRQLPDLPLQAGAAIVPENQIRAKFQSYHSPLPPFLALLKAQPNARVALVGTPPPNPDNDYLMSLLPVELPFVFKPEGVPEEQLKLTSPLVRLKLWRLAQDTYEEEALKAGAEFIAVPDTVTDADGFLKPEFWSLDLTHANSAYGQVMLAHVASILSKAPAIVSRGFHLEPPDAIAEPSAAAPTDTAGPDIASPQPEIAPPELPIDRAARDALRQRIIDSGLFDPEFYLERYLDVAESKDDPLEHYINYGGREGRNPNATFDAASYLALYPEAADQNPLLHYLDRGAKELQTIRERISESGLFDRAYYLTHYLDVARAQADPIDHYIWYGAREHRNPSALFNTAQYVAFHPEATGQNPLLHWLDHGAKDYQRLKQRVIDSGLFDAEFYASQNSDVRHSGMELIDHYINYGGAEGRDPSASFDTGAYLAVYPTVAGSNALVHYLEFGHKEGRAAQALRTPAPRPAPISRDDWRQLAERIAKLPHAAPKVDVIVPVYRGLDETANCLYTAIRSRLIARTPIEVVAIDDCSPEPEVSELLDRLAGLRLLTVLRNDKNLGFVTTVNRGMALHDDRDVVLLNSDTEVYGDWIDRLHAAAFAAPLVGTVTPFSNNATICSYPYNCGDFRFQFERTFAEMDALAAEVNRGRIFDLPTGVGFCLYIRRECLDEVGLFDADAFGLGYGEENDFCCRIAERGWRNVLAADIFVRHLGRTSFGQTAWGELQQRARRILEQRYPDFFKSIGAFVARDPIQVLRRRLDVARLRGCADRAILMVSHNIGGGTEKHVRELCHCLERNGIGSYIWQPLNANQARIVHAKLRDIPNLGILDVKHGLADAARLFAELGVFHIHVHHLFGLSRDALHFFPALSREMGIRYDFTFHDYLPLCPRVHMTDRNGVFCGKGDLASCEICIPKLDSPFGDVSVAGWRGSYEPLLRGARRLFGPDEDLRRRVEALSPQLKLTVRPHPEPVPEARRQPLARRPGEELRVAVWGNLTLIKGAEQLQSCAADAFRRRLPIRFVVFGQCETELRYLPNVELVGRYRSQDLPGILAARPCHIALIPSVCPESYSFVLSEAFFAGLFPVAFDLGAQARRIREYGWGLLLPFAWIDEPGRINDALLACDIPPMPERPPVGGSGLYPDFLADYYQLEYDSVAATSGSEVPTLALVS